MAPVEREESERRACADSRRAQHVVEQRDLPKAFSGTESADQLTVAEDFGLAVLDHVEPIAVIALVKDFLPSSHVDLVDVRRELVDRGHRQRPKDSDPIENRNLIVSVRDLRVDCL